MQIIDGKYHANQILADIKQQVKGHNVGFAIVLVGENAASKLYVNSKIKRSEEVGVNAQLIQLDSNVSQSSLLSEIDRLNTDKNIHGIIVQLPLPGHIDKDLVQQTIDPDKDVDGFHPVNVGYLYSEIDKGFIPCTPQGCMELIKSVESNLEGKIAVVIGRSGIVGKPMSALLLKENATVITCHSKTTNLSSITSKADIVVSAMGKPMFLKKEYFKNGAIVIDVGISKLENGKTVGDVDFEDIKDFGLKAISPVPGGVGPMTIAYLLKNVFKAYKNLSSND